MEQSAIECSVSTVVGFCLEVAGERNRIAGKIVGSAGHERQGETNLPTLLSGQEGLLDACRCSRFDCVAARLYDGFDNSL